MAEISTTKMCRVCSEQKPLDNFHRQASSRDGRDSRCKPCACARQREWRAENVTRGEHAAAEREWRRKNSYGQFGVDHDHGCCPGKWSCGDCVRGLLCHGCNAALGNIGDDLARLRKLVAYLSRYQPEAVSRG